MRGRHGMMSLVVDEIVRETPSIVSVWLADPDGRPLPSWDPGSHIDLQLITRHERQYSLCGDPTDAHRYRIAVRREARSRGGSHYIHNFLRVGSRVWVGPPRNLFALSDAPSYLLLAAGIGVTPILSMARQLAAEGLDWRMVYLSREREDVAFAHEIAALGDRARVHVSAARGRLDLAAELASIEPETHVYACGPQGFVDQLSDLATDLPEGCRLHTERFEPRKREFLPNSAFTVVCVGSNVTVEVPTDRTMLSMLQAAGLPAEGSCLRGVCGSCSLRVLDGTPEHRDSLTANDDSMTIYPCVSRAITSTLTIDV